MKYSFFYPLQLYGETAQKYNQTKKKQTMKETIYYSTILNIRDYLTDVQKEEIRKDIQERLENIKSYAMQETSDIQEARQKYTVYQELITLI